MAVQSDTLRRDIGVGNEMGNQINEHSLASLLNSLHLRGTNVPGSRLLHKTEESDVINPRDFFVGHSENKGLVTNEWDKVACKNRTSDPRLAPETQSSAKGAITFTKPTNLSTSGLLLASKGSILLNGGLGSLDRWEGLKEWHQRHKELLDGRDNASKNVRNSQPEEEGNSNNISQLPPLASCSVSDPVSITLRLNKGLSSAQSDAPQALKTHDLSMIPEGDEDLKVKDDDVDSMLRKSGATSLPSLFGKIPTNDKGKKVAEGYCATENDKSKGLIQNENTYQKTESCVNRRTFLRKGQGLARYKLGPEDVKVPYRKAVTRKNIPNSSGRKQIFRSIRPGTSYGTQTEISRNSSHLKQESQPRKSVLSQPPLQRLVLTVPARNIVSKHGDLDEVGTWSELFSRESEEGKDINDKNMEQDWKKEEDKLVFENQLKESLPSEVMKRTMLSEPMLSPKRNKHLSSNQSSPPEEDQESLAAYLDLEQHVGNASFCSTSSKVDRLVAQSSKSNLHPSNPDTISMSQPQSSKKSIRRSGNDENGRPSVVTDQVSMWTTSELENLIKSRARRPKSFGKEVKAGRTVGPFAAKRKNFFDDNTPWQEGSHEPPVTSRGSVHTILDTVVVNQVNKPHLMKTMPAIDLNSSLVQNALLDHSNTPHAPASDSDSSSETSFESNYGEMSDGDPNHVIPDKNNTKQGFEKGTEKYANADNGRLPADLIKVEGINQQIDAHLAHLRKEIETLQCANNKSQRSVFGLEKKVKELEQRLMLEAHSSERRLAEERDAAAKTLAEERAKFSKEKQVLERNLREQRKKVSDPLSQQELLRLKQEVVQWEEKWRADRAKSRGLESNLRIQITNLKREIEKLKEDNSRLRREKETAVNAEKAKTVSNTRIINTIAQKLGKAKPHVSVIREKIANGPSKSSVVKTSSSASLPLVTGSAYNLKPSHNGKADPPKPKPVATIGTFPKLCSSVNEWSSDDEIDLGKETEEEDEDVKGSPQRGSFANTDDNAQELLDPISNVPSGSAQDDANVSDAAMEEARNKYEAIFGPNSHDADRYLEDVELGYLRSTKASKPQSPNDEQKSEKYIKTIRHPDGRIEQVKRNGTRVITYPDGTWERHSPSGSIMTVPPNSWPVQILYFNGDKLEKMEDGTVKYFYAKTKTWQTTFADGHEEVQFPSGQVERHQRDGTVQVLFPGTGTSTSSTKDSSEVGSYPEGMSVERTVSGDTIIHLANGERELHTKEFMRKDFLDGTVKFMYKDGSQETRYPSGRIRVKDAQGNLLKDTSFPSP